MVFPVSGFPRKKSLCCLFSRLYLVLVCVGCCWRWFDRVVASHLIRIWEKD